MEIMRRNENKPYNGLLVSNLFHDAFKLHRLYSVEREMVVNDERRRIWKKPVVAYFKVGGVLPTL